MGLSADQRAAYDVYICTHMGSTMRTVGQPYKKHHGVTGEYDAIVIGSGMGGMSVATILAKNDHRVLLLEQNTIIGGLTQTYARDGYRWNTGLHYIGDVEEKGKMTRRLFDYVTDGQLEWARLPSIYNRMRIGEQSYAIPAGREAYRQALLSWFPEDADAIDAYLEDIQQVSRASRGHFGQKVFPTDAVSGQWDAMNEEFHHYSSMTTKAALLRYTSNDLLIAVLCANWGDYSAPPERSSYAMHCMLAKHYMDGGSFPVGGAARLAETMMPIVERAGGKVLHSAKVDRILVEDHRAVGVQLSSGEQIHSPLVISNAGVQNTFGRLMAADDAGRVGAKEMLDSITDTYCLVGINVGLKGDAEALEIDPANIWWHPTSDFEANLAAHKADFQQPFPWLFITFPSAKDPAWEHEYAGKSTVEMYAVTDFEHFAEWQGSQWRKRGEAYEQRKNEIKQRLLRSLFEVAPQLEEAVDVVEVSTPLTYETFVCREHGGFMGIESNPARFNQPWLRSPTSIQGLYLTGQDVTSDGIIGALMGGVIAASAILGKDVLADVKAFSSNAN